MRRLALVLCLALAACAPHQRVLKVCADPNNLPFSNARGEGFENRLAEMVARDLHARVQYVWWAQRRGYVRNTLKEGRCQLWPGVASQLEMLSTTAPYYRSTYVFLTRADRELDIESLDDPRLKTLKIGVQLVGDDGANTPPAHALARRGIVGNLHGYTLYGDYSHPNPPAAIVDAVDRGDVDVALVWGPLAGYFAQRAQHPMRIAPVRPWLDGPQWPMEFDVSMGVNKGDTKLHDALDRILAQRRPEVRRLLHDYGVPLVERGPSEPL
jgi:mxaJ protein